jgi:hypothetical protein
MDLDKSASRIMLRTFLRKGRFATPYILGQGLGLSRYRYDH